MSGTTSPDHKTEEAVKGTFPASDPLGTTNTRGARAVPPEEMMTEAPPIEDGITLTRCFDDVESAKLALESLVRDAPIDRRYAELSTGGRVELRLHVPSADRTRIQALLDRA